MVKCIKRYKYKKINSIGKDKAELEKQCINFKLRNLKLQTKRGNKDKERATEVYSKQEITQPSKSYACGLQEYQTRDCNTYRNIFFRYDRLDTMDVQQLKSIMTEYEKNIKLIQYQH